MAKVTRRRFLQGASVGAAAVGVLAVGPSLGTSHSAAGASASRAPSAAPGAGAASASAHDALTTTAASEPIVAYVRDPSKGEVAIFVGTREIIRQDPDLAARLSHAIA